MQTAKQKIVPRWEWRIFGQDFNFAEGIIRQYPCQRVRTTQEIYILSPHSPNNCKIRDGLMDIKTLVRKNDHQLELWRPVLKAAFPLDYEILRLLLRTLKVSSPKVEITNISISDLLNVIVPNQPNLRTIEVQKERYGYEIEHATVEIAQLTINNRQLRTIAIEHEDAQVVLALVKRLGFEPATNMNYIQVLKREIGWNEEAN